MELNILERLLILRAIPKEGDIITLRVLSDLRRNLSLTEEEISEHNVRSVGDRVLFDDPDYKLEIAIGEKAFDLIQSAFSNLNNIKKLTIEDIPLYERFVEKKEVGK
jgi:hypothetical protein